MYRRWSTWSDTLYSSQSSLHLWFFCNIYHVVWLLFWQFRNSISVFLQFLQIFFKHTTVDLWVQYSKPLRISLEWMLLTKVTAGSWTLSVYLILWLRDPSSSPNFLVEVRACDTLIHAWLSLSGLENQQKTCQVHSRGIQFCLLDHCSSLPLF